MNKALQGAAYAPIVRTRAAELNGLRELDDHILDALLPVIEFTRSRRSKSNPGGSIDISIQNIAAILKSRPFVADLTSLDSQANGEVSDLLDPANGFHAWTEFVDESLPSNVIPVVHLTEPFDHANFNTQVAALLPKSGLVALRIPTSYQQASEVLEAAAQLGAPFVLLIDAGFVRPDSVHGASSATQNLAKLSLRYSPSLIVPVSSSFPASVVLPGYGGDETGAFVLSEVVISDQLKASMQGVRVIHGDYACIHPLDFDGTVTAWVPRVDIPLDRSLYYRRYRRNDGGYGLAAKRALEDDRYVPLDCWAHKNVVAAASGNPLGKSPSHWISVRLNFHISRQFARLM